MTYPFDEGRDLYRQVEQLMKTETVSFSQKPAGRFFESGFTVSPVVNYRNQEVRQNMKHLCAFFLKWVQSQGIKDNEIQMMQVGQAVIVTANTAESIDRLHAEFSARKTHALRALIAEYLQDVVDAKEDKANKTRKKKRPIEKADDIRKVLDEDGDQDLLRFCAKLWQKLERPGTRDAIIRDFSQLGLDVQGAPSLHHAPDAPSAASLLTRPSSPAQIIFLAPKEGVHAEQNFMLLLLDMSPPTVPISIYGSKRPCYMCFACLNFYQQHYPVQMQINVRPGQYWSTAAAAFAYITGQFAQQAQIPDDEVVDWLQNFIRTHSQMYFAERKLPRRRRVLARRLRPRVKPNAKRPKEYDLTDTASNNYQSDSESEAEDETYESLAQNRAKRRKGPGSPQS